MLQILETFQRETYRKNTVIYSKKIKKKFQQLIYEHAFKTIILQIQISMGLELLIYINLLFVSYI